MPLTQFQADVFKIISRNRNPDSYVAGGIVIHRDAASSRYSKDIDLFHDTSEAVAASAKLDEVALREAGYEVEFSMEKPTFHRASVAREGQKIRLEWAADSAFRFFPIVEDEILGYRLHNADVATNKVLAAAGREKIVISSTSFIWIKFTFRLVWLFGHLRAKMKVIRPNFLSIK